MNESKELTVTAYLNPEIWGQMEKVANALVQSKSFPKNIQNGPQAMVVMQAGIEMGMKPLEAIQSLTIINGAINTWGKATTKRLRDHGWRIKYVDKTEEGGSCTATVTKGEETYTDTVTFKKAQLSKWTHANGVLKAGWYEGENREMKLRYNALSKIIKTYIPEVLGSAQDIAEVAEDFIIVEEAPVATDTNVGTKTTEVMTATPDERKQGLADFLKKEEEKPPKAVKIDKKVVKPAKNEPEIVENAQKVQNTATDKAEAQEAEIVE